MDFSAVEFDEVAESLHDRVRNLLDELLGEEPDWPVRERESEPPNLHRALGGEGLIAPLWTVEEGGSDAGILGDRLIAEELARRQIYISRTPVMLAATIRKYANDEQFKSDVLAGIASGEVRICLGYSEPDGGSDIASARTRAIRDGDEWLINGTKVFTSVAHRSQYIFLITKTNLEAPKHHNLTMFLVPLLLPGIDLQPLITIGGDRLNMTFFNDVRVADKYRLGQIDAGWKVLHDPLDSEHGIGDADEGRLGDIHGQGSLSTIPVSVALARALRWGARRDDRTGTVPMDQPLVAAALASAAVDLEVARNTPGPMGKIAASEAYARIATSLMDVTGLLGTISQGDPDALESGAFDWAHRRAQAPSIAGGTVEVFKNIVAESVLGLPKQLPGIAR